MITIIQSGKLDSKIFSCTKCGCVFEADESEWTKDIFCDTIFISCKCPTCNSWVDLNNQEVEND